MGNEFRTEELFECDRCGALLPGDLMVWLDNGEIYCEDCYDKLCEEEDEDAEEEYVEYYEPQQQWIRPIVPFYTLYSVANHPQSLFLSQLPPKQREAFMNEIVAGRDPFKNEVLMSKTQSLKLRNFNSVSFAVSEENPSIISSIGFISVRDANIIGRRKDVLGPERSFRKVWEKFMNEHDYGPVPFVSYNADIERKWLKATLAANWMEDPDTAFIDVLAHSRKHFKNKLSDFHLKTTAARCGYDLWDKHNLLNEAEAIAMVAMKAIPISELLR